MVESCGFAAARTNFARIAAVPSGGLHECPVQPPNLADLKKSLEQLPAFLAGSGRTNANCWATDMFFMLSDEWERDRTEQELPEEFHDVLSLIGDALHDTVQAPDVAENFGCLPEQLLDG